MRPLAMPFALMLCCSLQSGAAEGDWQTLSVDAEQTNDAGQKRKCEIKVPAGWTLQDKGATLASDYTATLVFEAERPEAWWAKRKKVDFKNSRMFQDTRANYWIQIQGALIADTPAGTTHIAGMRDGGLVCHAVVDFTASNWDYENWEKLYGETVREMIGSMKPQ